MSLEQQRAEERALYQRVHSALPEYGDGGMFVEVQDHVARILAHPYCHRVWDVGCGKGAFVRWAAEHNVVSVCGTDLVDLDWYARPQHPRAWFYAAPAHHITHLAGAGGVDLVTCWDVLEHLLPEEVPEVLEAWASLNTDWIMFSIHHGPAVRELDGEVIHLHRCQRPASWWIDQIDMAFDPNRYVAPVIHQTDTTTYWLIHHRRVECYP